MSKNIFLATGSHTAAPWQIKPDRKNHRLIQGANGEHIAHVFPHGNPAINNTQYRANCAVLTAAPQLLAALKEATFVMIENGIPVQPALVELLRTAMNDPDWQLPK